ncbi:hypothetical protein ACLOJK_016380 [Asimina triloba]
MIRIAAKKPETTDPVMETLLKTGRAALLSPAGAAAGDPEGGLAMDEVGDPVGDEVGAGEDAGGAGGETTVEGEGEEAGGLDTGEGADAGGVDVGVGAARGGETVGAAEGEDPGACEKADPIIKPSIVRITRKLLLEKAIFF